MKMSRHIFSRFMSLLALQVAMQAAAAVVPAPPSVAARAFLVQDFETGQVLAEQNADERVEPASLTKMMTAYLVSREIEKGNLGTDVMVRVSEKAWRMGGSKMFIEVDKEVSVGDLLRGVIVQSGNDASVALAEHIAGSEEVFAAMMNEEAKRLGMTGTHFTNSTGWPDPEHYTTTRDLATLAIALVRDYPDEYALYALKEFTFNGITQQNRNEMLWRDESVDGIKTGHTESAGYCLVASARREGMRLVSVVMGTDGTKARTRATESLINYAFRFYETGRVLEAGATVTTARIWKGQAQEVRLGVSRSVSVTVPRGSLGKVELVPQPADRLQAPMDKGAEAGTVTIRVEGKDVGSQPLVALEAVPEAGLFRRVMDDIMLIFE